MSKLSDRLCWGIECREPYQCNVLRTCVTKLKLEAQREAREAALDAEISKRAGRAVVVARTPLPRPGPLETLRIAGADPLSELARLIGQSDPFTEGRFVWGEPVDQFKTDHGVTLDAYRRHVRDK